MTTETARVSDAIRVIEWHVEGLALQIEELRTERDMYMSFYEQDMESLAAFKIEIGIDPDVSLSIADIAAIKAAVQAALGMYKCIG